jgi:Integrase core domain
VKWLDEKCIEHIRGAPGHPQTQGKIERWHQTLKNRILLENYFLPGELEAKIEAFVKHYNHQRHHESLKNLTSADVYSGRGQTILLERERIKRHTPAPSSVTVLVAAAALGSKQGGQGVDRGAGIGVRIKTPAALGAETAPVADQQRSPEQIGPDFHPIEPPFVRFRTDANEGGGFRKERKLDGSGAFRARFTASGHGVGRNVSRWGKCERSSSTSRSMSFDPRSRAGERRGRHAFRRPWCCFHPHPCVREPKT